MPQAKVLAQPSIRALGSHLPYHSRRSGRPASRSASPAGHPPVRQPTGLPLRPICPAGSQSAGPAEHPGAGGGVEDEGGEIAGVAPSGRAPALPPHDDLAAPRAEVVAQRGIRPADGRSPYHSWRDVHTASGRGRPARYPLAWQAISLPLTAICPAPPAKVVAQGGIQGAAAALGYHCGVVGRPGTWKW